MISKKHLLLGIFMLLSVSIIFTSCGDDDDDTPLMTKEFQYQVHNGQTVATTPYAGTHASNLTATLLLEELENGNTNITVTLQNTNDGEVYNVHAHDAADAASTPNGTPYIETPNSSIFVNAIDGNGGSASKTQEAEMSFSELTSNYNGFFVIHDPLQSVSTTDLSTFVVLGSFARSQPEVTYKSTSFQYDFNTGQLVESFAYTGSHNDNLGASITVEELAGDQSRITVSIMNTMDGETYHTHAHDVADASMTPNGTPYIESPNSDVFVAGINGNGGTSSMANISSKSYSEITGSYEGFFVIHDPLQAVSTTDPTTFVILGSFAR